MLQSKLAGRGTYNMSISNKKKKKSSGIIQDNHLNSIQNLKFFV